MKAIVAALFLAFFAQNNAQLPSVPAAAVAAQQAPAQAQAQAQGPPAAAIPLIPLDPGSLQCSLNECAGRTIEVRPSQGWAFDCPGNCRDMVLNIRVGLDPANPGHMVTRLGGIKCNGVNACKGAVVNIYNENGLAAEAVQLGDLLCESPGACQCMAIHAFGNVDIWTADFSCLVPGSCRGCIVKDNMKIEACDANDNINGQLTMPWQVRCSGAKSNQQVQNEYMLKQQEHFQQAQLLNQQRAMQQNQVVYPQVMAQTQPVVAQAAQPQPPVTYPQQMQAPQQYYPQFNPYANFNPYQYYQV